MALLTERFVGRCFALGFKLSLYLALRRLDFPLLGFPLLLSQSVSPLEVGHLSIAIG
jgi:hypothetical protein